MGIRIVSLVIAVDDVEVFPCVRVEQPQAVDVVRND